MSSRPISEIVSGCVCPDVRAGISPVARKANIRHIRRSQQWVRIPRRMDRDGWLWARGPMFISWAVTSNQSNGAGCDFSQGISVCLIEIPYPIRRVRAPSTVTAAPFPLSPRTTPRDSHASHSLFFLLRSSFFQLRSFSLAASFRRYVPFRAAPFLILSSLLFHLILRKSILLPGYFARDIIIFRLQR